jgi:hypothetical protein
VVRADSPRIPRVPGYSGAAQEADRLSSTGLSPSVASVSTGPSTSRQLCNSLRARQRPLSGPTTPCAQRLPSSTRTRFRLLPVRSPLLRECLFLRVLRCFSSPGALCPAYVFSRECLGITPGRLPHSEIPGSSLASSSPRRFAGSRVLHRRLVPRHPPWTLRSLPCLQPLLSSEAWSQQLEDPD